jgi:hypothetical protein
MAETMRQVLRVLACANAVFAHFDFVDAFERKKKMDEIFGGFGGSLTNNFADGVSDGRMEQHASGLDSSKIDADELAFVEHDFIVGARRGIYNASEEQNETRHHETVTVCTAMQQPKSGLSQNRVLSYNAARS